MWSQLLNEGRRKKDHLAAQAGAAASPKTHDQTQATTHAGDDTRTEIERDYDRILFSTPVRRLADKTQVFPLERNDSVRTRLTHSHEVSNLGRSIGTALVFQHGIGRQTACGNERSDGSASGDGSQHLSAADLKALRNIPALMAAVGLAHDLGNPPFGHQGEGAIQSWFADHARAVLQPLTLEQHRQDFLRFEGNAQGLRLVARLQLIDDDFGLDLTYATLAALMKYPCASDQIDKTHVARKKHGFFAAEQPAVEQVWQATGLGPGKRHALAYLMEACDDTAYLVLDAEDAVKKGLASFSDLMDFLLSHGAGDAVIASVVQSSLQRHREHQQTRALSPAELNDISMQRFRIFAIGAMVRAVTAAFVRHQTQLVRGELSCSLIEVSDAAALCEALKAFSVAHAYRHRSVLALDLQGFNVIRDLMDVFWAAIVDRADGDNPSSRRNHPFTRYVYARMSENYRRIFENPSAADARLPLRYRECLLLTDMVSGMTDTYAVDLHRELLTAQGPFDVRQFLR